MRAHSDCALILALATFIAVDGNAAEPRWPTQPEIDAAKNHHRLPALDELARQPLPRVPNIEIKPSAIDVQDIARRYANNQIAFSGTEAQLPGLMIFVTLAMPDASLRLLATQAARSGATLLVRGLKDDSMQHTLSAVKKVIGDERVSWHIDPPAFTRYRIEHAPTFVLVASHATPFASDGSCTSGCARPDSFLSVSGDVSLDYALDVMARTRPAFSADAQRYQKRLSPTSRP